MEATFSVYRKMGAAPAVALHGQVATKPHIVELMLDLAAPRRPENVRARPRLR